MAALATQSVAIDGTDVTFAAAAGGGDTCDASDGVLLLVKNDDASGITVTVGTPRTVDGLAIADQTVSVDAGDITGIAMKRSLYGDPSTGLAAISYSAVTNVTVAVVRL